MNNNRIVSKISGQVQCFSHPRYIPKFADSSYIPQLYFPIAVSSSATQSTHTPTNIILNHLVPTIWKHELMKTGRRTKNREYHIDLYWKPKKETNKKNKQTQNNFTPIVSKQETPSRNQEKSHWQKITTGLHQKSVDVKNQNAKYQKKIKYQFLGLYSMLELLLPRFHTVATENLSLFRHFSIFSHKARSPKVTARFFL